jgi:hypothetical protein
MKVLSFIALFFSITPQVPTENQDVKTETKKEVITEKHEPCATIKAAESRKSFFSFFFFN